MTIEIPESLARDANLDEKSALLELALTLYAQERISGSQLRRMCGLGYFEFFDLALARGLPTCIVSDEHVLQDIENLKKNGGL